MRNNSGSNALHLAAYNGYLEVVKYLIEEKSLDFNIKNNAEKSPLLLALNNEHKDIANYIVQQMRVDGSASMSSLSP